MITTNAEDAFVEVDQICGDRSGTLRKLVGWPSVKYQYFLLQKSFQVETDLFRPSRELTNQNAPSPTKF